nr:CcdB family protein [Polymorphobacter sp.]
MRALQKCFATTRSGLCIDSTGYVVLTQAFASVPTREFGRAVTSIAAQADAIDNAIEFLLFGF